MDFQLALLLSAQLRSVLALCFFDWMNFTLLESQGVGQSGWWAIEVQDNHTIQSAVRFRQEKLGWGKENIFSVQKTVKKCNIQDLPWLRSWYHLESLGSIYMDPPETCDECHKNPNHDFMADTFVLCIVPNWFEKTLFIPGHTVELSTDFRQDSTALSSQQTQWGFQL